MNHATFGVDPNPGGIKELQSKDLAYASLNTKIMCVGDSITGFYIDELYREITADTRAFINFDFVGNANSPPRDTNGYGGYVSNDLLRPAGSGTKGTQTGGLYNGDAGDLITWMDGMAPDIVLLHIGTNDGADNSVQHAATVISAYTVILQAARDRNPSVKFFVARIIPQLNNESWAQTLGSMVPAWAAANSTAQSPIAVVDQYTGFNPSVYNAITNPVGMTRDGTHPTTLTDNPNGLSGAQFMAARWLAAIHGELHSAR